MCLSERVPDPHRDGLLKAAVLLRLGSDLLEVEMRRENEEEDRRTGAGGLESRGGKSAPDQPVDDPGQDDRREEEDDDGEEKDPPEADVRREEAGKKSQREGDEDDPRSLAIGTAAKGDEREEQARNEKDGLDQAEGAPRPREPGVRSLNEEFSGDPAQKSDPLAGVPEEGTLGKVPRPEVRKKGPVASECRERCPAREGEDGGAGAPLPGLPAKFLRLEKRRYGDERKDDERGHLVRRIDEPSGRQERTPADHPRERAGRPGFEIESENEKELQRREDVLGIAVARDRDVPRRKGQKRGEDQREPPALLRGRPPARPRKSSASRGARR